MVIPLVVLALTGCASFRTPPLPPVTGAGSTQIAVGKFVWRDLLTSDPAGAKSFYGDLFAWQFRETGDGEYAVITSRGNPIGGVASHKSTESAAAPAFWLSSLSVANVDAAVDRVEESFGSVLDGPGTAGPRGRVAIVRDPAGAPLALIRAEGGDPLDSPPEEGSWVWTDLLTDDMEEAEAFYQSLVGYSVRTLVVPDGGLYRVLESGGIARAGLVPLPWREIDAHWLPYVAVRDLDSVLQRAVELGGRVVLGPEVFGGGDRIAVLADPAGGVVGLQELPSRPARTREAE